MDVKQGSGEYVASFKAQAVTNLLHIPSFILYLTRSVISQLNGPKDWQTNYAFKNRGGHDLEWEVLRRGGSTPRTLTAHCSVPHFTAIFILQLFPVFLQKIRKPFFPRNQSLALREEFNS